MSYILACDPGSIRTGWAVLKSSPLSYCESGVIDIEHDIFWERIGLLKKALMPLIEKYNPACLVLEQAFVGINKQAALKLSQIRGALMGLCHEPGLQYAEYSPREVKATIAGYGAATKEQVFAMIQRSLPSFPAHVKTWDESDAIAIALCHAYAQKNPLYTLSRKNKR